MVPYVQTTGSRGLHVVIPLRADTDFDIVRQFARDIADVVAADDPAHRTVEIRKDDRDGRVYLESCGMPTRKPRSRPTPCEPAAERRSRLRWSGTSFFPTGA